MQSNYTNWLDVVQKSWISNKMENENKKPVTIIKLLPFVIVREIEGHQTIAPIQNLCQSVRVSLILSNRLGIDQ